jgi:AcrR family transcriptional regulator
VHAARELLEETGSAELSLRAVARRAGVSPTAPYRHYADREALVSAVAAEGYRELAAHLAAAHPAPSTTDDLAAVAVAYVAFALEHRALFRAMFVEPCDPRNEDRTVAAAEVFSYVSTMVTDAFPGTDPAVMSTAVWALVHGLAFLHLDGKLDTSDLKVVADRVDSAVRALLATTPTNGTKNTRSSLKRRRSPQ